MTQANSGSGRTTRNRTFVAGMAAGGAVFLMGILLGGAGHGGLGNNNGNGPGWNWNGRGSGGSSAYVEGNFDVVKTRRFEIVDRWGDPLLQINPNAEGATMTFFDGQGDRRVRLTSDGLVAVYDEQGRMRARMLAETQRPHGGGQVATFNRHGQRIGH